MDILTLTLAIVMLSCSSFALGYHTGENRWRGKYEEAVISGAKTLSTFLRWHNSGQPQKSPIQIENL